MNPYRFARRLMRQAVEARITTLFHKLWYHSPDTWARNTFLGYPILQCPFDLQLYQETIFKTKPSYILQTGVAGGGSLLYFATILDAMGAPPETIVAGIDIKLMESAKTLSHPRIRLYEGDSADPAMAMKVRESLPAGSGFVILDSDHSARHVAAELEIYSTFVGTDSYLVVEDCNINGHPVLRQFGPGPREAAVAFLENHPEFVDDSLWKRNRLSFHQGGWLRKTR